jgi:UDP-glucose 4-epimerase
MKVLVTGGAGFIGSHLVDALLARGDEVVVLDDLSTGRTENIQAHQDNRQFSFVRGDIRDAALLQLLVREADVVYHLAAAVGVQLIAEDPVRTIATNIGGTEVILEMANRFNRPVFLASTSEVYGKSDQVPFREDDDFVLGSTRFSRWAYACSKAVDEFLGQAYFDQYGLSVIIGRFFNTVGPRQTGQYGMVVPRFVRWALQAAPLNIYGTGQQSRCFCYVGDVVQALLGLMASDRAFGKVFNIGATEEISIEGLADRVINLTKSKSKKVFVAYEDAYSRPIEDMQRRLPSTEKIHSAIGWQPETDLDTILKEVIAFEKGRL